MTSEKEIVDLSLASIVRTVALVVGALLLFVLRDIVLLLFTAFIIGSGFYLIGQFLQRRLGVPYKVGVTGAVLGLAIVVGGLLYPIVPRLAEDMSNLQQQIPTFIEQGKKWRQTVSSETNEAASVSTEQVNTYAQNVVSGVFFTTRNILGGAVYTLVLVVISLYLAFEPRNLEEMISDFWPAGRREAVRQTVINAREKVGNWIIGQGIIAVILGVLSYVALWLLGVENALLLGIIAGFLNLIPFIGPILSLIPAAIFGFLESIQVGVGVIIAYIVIQQLEGSFLTPAIMNQVTGLSHILIIISILVGGTLAGALGAIIAIPFMSVLSLFVKGLETETEAGGTSKT